MLNRLMCSTVRITHIRILIKLKSNTWLRADWWDEGRCALCRPHLSSVVIQPSDGRHREPLPLPAAPDKIKGMTTDRETDSHAQLILPHSLQQQQKALSEGLQAAQYNHSLIYLLLSKTHWSSLESSTHSTLSC